jgi:polyketide cyclase/dehydrase/lipid transport protein
VRDFRLRNGDRIREKLLGLSDYDMFCTYSILESPMGVDNYVATLRLTPVTDGDQTFMEWRVVLMLSNVPSEASVPHIVKSTVLDAPTGAVWNVLRDFNGHDRWHPAVATSTIERAQASDKIGCIRRFRLQDGSELREQLLALSDLEQTFSYCLLDTPIPMFNYVAHVRLLPVTDGDRTFWHWESRFTTRPADAAPLTQMVSEQIYQAGFDAIRRHLKEAA